MLTRLPRNRSLLLLGMIVLSISAISCSGSLQSTSESSTQSVSSNQGSGEQTQDGETAQPPVNVAGAYLVEPQVTSCENETREQHLISVCEVEYAARVAATAPSAASLWLDSGKAKGQVSYSSQGGVTVQAASVAKAIESGKQNLIAKSIAFRAQGMSGRANKVFTLMNGAGKVKIYSRTTMEGSERAREIVSSMTEVTGQFEGAAISWLSTMDQVGAARVAERVDLEWLAKMIESGFSLAIGR